MLVVGEQSTMAEVDGILVAQGEEVKGKVAGELHGLKVKLAEGLGWLEKGRRRRSTGDRATGVGDEGEGSEGCRN